MIPIGIMASRPAAGGGGLLLDAYTTNLHAAYSTSLKLLTSYSGPIIRIKRESDATEMDVSALASNSIDLTNGTLLSFVSGTTARLHTRYDQTGNGRHQTIEEALTGPVAGAPVIYTSGAFKTQNGNLFGEADAAAHGLATMTEFSAYTGSTLTMIITAKMTTTTQGSERFCCATTGGDLDWNTASGVVMIMRDGTSEALGGYRNAGALASGVATTAAQWFAAGARLTGSQHVLRSGASATASASSSGTLNVTRWLDGPELVILGAPGRGVGSGWGEQFVWTGDIGSTAVDAIISSLRTYRGAQ